MEDNSVRSTNIHISSCATTVSLIAFLPPSQAEKQRTARHTENKRRYRARRQEYVADLERKLAEGRHQEVAAMREMQLAAQKVIHENARLRALLQFTGVESKVVESWVRGDETCARTLAMANALPPSSISRPTPLGSVSARDSEFVEILC